MIYCLKVRHLWRINRNKSDLESWGALCFMRALVSRESLDGVLLTYLILEQIVLVLLYFKY
jgi:hypothetical protein